MEHKVGAIVDGTVVDIAHFGAFVKIRGGKTGLIHISQISEKYIKNISDHLKIGDAVVAKVVSMDEKGRVQLSIKNVTPEESAAFLNGGKTPVEKPTESHTGSFSRNPDQPARDHSVHSDSRSFPEDSFERKMKQFLHDSEDRLVDVKRQLDSKRGVKRKKK